MAFRRLFLVAAAACALSAPAHAFEIDLAGQLVDGALTQILVPNANTNAVASIEYNLVYEALSPSYGSELIIQLTHVDSDIFVQLGTQADSCSAFSTLCTVDLAWDGASGVYTASGSIQISLAIANGAGNWEVLFGDSFDDAGIDGQFLAGSTLTITQVPLPAAAWLLSAALVTLTRVSRRRRT